MAQDPKPALLTLHNHSAQVLIRPADQLAYAIRWFFVNPGSTSSNNEGEMISFRKLNAKYGNSPADFTSMISGMLTAIVSKYYPGATAEVEYEKKDGYSNDGAHKGNYGLIIKVADAGGNAIIPSGRIVIGGDNDTIDCKFDAQ